MPVDPDVSAACAALLATAANDGSPLAGVVQTLVTVGFLWYLIHYRRGDPPSKG